MVGLEPGWEVDFEAGAAGFFVVAGFLAAGFVVWGWDFAVVLAGFLAGVLVERAA